MAKRRLDFPSKALRDALSDDETWENYRRFRKNVAWFDEHLQNIKKKHGGETVIVLDGKLEFSSPDIDDVMEKLRSLPGLSQAYVRYVSKGKTILVR